MMNIVIWCAAYAVYLLFAGTMSLHELAVGAALAVLSAVWAWTIRQNSWRRFSARGEQIVPVLHALAGVPAATLHTGTVLLMAALRGGSPGRAIRLRFHSGLDEEPRQRTRRALAVLAASLAPNRFVVNISRAKGEAMIHAIDAEDSTPDPEWLA